MRFSVLIASALFWSLSTGSQPARADGTASLHGTLVEPSHDVDSHGEYLTPVYFETSGHYVKLTGGQANQTVNVHWAMYVGVEDPEGWPDSDVQSTYVPKTLDGMGEWRHYAHDTGALIGIMELPEFGYWATGWSEVFCSTLGCSSSGYVPWHRWFVVQDMG